MSSTTLTTKIAQGSAQLAQAQKEVSLLLQELNAGTLNRTTLLAGLESLQQTVSQVAAHIPTFADKIGGGQ